MSNDVLLVPVTVEQPNVEAQSDVVVFVPQAHQNKPGIVKAGDGVNINNGEISLDRQTVEDMIDANKWISYGFQQNLSEDEKGLARHNIGAGDNDFTGSYYDVTQKPHLNTDNTESLITGDEEINYTINLHKVSKTGSFEDLNDVPEETLEFAEEERQKSKNLFDKNAVRMYKSMYGGTGSSQCGDIANHNEYFVSDDIYVHGLSNIILSGSIGYNNVSVFLDENKVPFRVDNRLSDGLINTLSVPEDAYYFRFECSITHINNNIQLEEGTVPTEYVPYYGQIVHKADIVDFESLRILPNEYQEVEYIESSGTQYINTGYVTKYGDTVEVEFEYTTINNIYNFIYGATSPTNTDPVVKFGIIYDTGTYAPVMEIVGASYVGNSLYAFNKKVYKMVLASGNQQLYIDNIEVATGTESAVLPNHTAFLFASNNGNNTYLDGNQANGKLYKVTIKSGATLVREFVPCYRKSDGEIGLYDTVENVFYTNQGDGTFLKGENIYLSNVSRRTDAEVVFAESEMQKSKNLFDGNLIQGAYDSGTGEYVASNYYVCSQNKISVVPNASLYLTFDTELPIILKNSGFVFYDNGTFVSATDGTFSTTVPSNANQVGFSIGVAYLNDVAEFSHVVLSHYGAIVHEIELDGLKGKELWKNPDPTVQFVAQDVTLSSSDYDYLGIYYYASTSNKRCLYCEYIKDTYGFALIFSNTNASGAVTYVRNANVNETTVHFEVAYQATGASAEFANNGCCVPVKIIGYKRS